MKRTVLLVLAFGILPWIACASEWNTSLAWNGTMASATVRASFSTSAVHMSCTLSQEESGWLTFSAPPGFTVAGENWCIGEMRTAGLLSALLVADELHVFKDQYLLKPPGSLSENPSLTGAGISSGPFTFILMSSLLGPKSPDGFGVLYSKGGFFAGAVRASSNTRLDDGTYQTRWENSPGGRNIIQSIVGTRSQLRFEGCKMESAVFARTSWDWLMGGGTTVYFGTSAKFPNLFADIEIMQGGDGAVLFGTKEASRPEQLVEVHLETGTKWRLEADASWSVGQEPVFGGTCSPVDRSLALTLSKRNVSISAKSEMGVSTQNRKSASTSFSVGYENVAAELSLSRSGGGFGFKSVSLSAKAGSMNAGIRFGQDDVTVSLSIRLGDWTFQDTGRKSVTVTKSIL